MSSCEHAQLLTVGPLVSSCAIVSADGPPLQPLSTKRSEGTIKFGKADRYPTPKAAALPAPGQYGAGTESFGSQSLSTRKTARSPTFGAR